MNFDELETIYQCIIYFIHKSFITQTVGTLNLQIKYSQNNILIISA